MERSHTPLNVWFWAAYLVASQTPGMSAVQFQRQLVRIPMKAATDSDGKRPPVPIQNGHFGRGSNWAS